MYILIATFSCLCVLQLCFVHCTVGFIPVLCTNLSISTEHLGVISFWPGQAGWLPFRLYEWLLLPPGCQSDKTNISQDGGLSCNREDFLLGEERSHPSMFNKFIFTVTRCSHMSAVYCLKLRISLLKDLSGLTFTTLNEASFGSDCCNIQREDFYVHQKQKDVKARQKRHKYW